MMTLEKLIEQLKIIHQERMLAAHHDNIFFQTHADVEALDKIIVMLKFLADKNPDYRLTVGEILDAAKIKY